MDHKDCPFCHPKDKDLIIQSDEYALVMLSDPYLLAGHLLIIPRRHIEQPWELGRREITQVFEYVLYYMSVIRQEGLGEGCDVRLNYRPFVSQGSLKVNHSHFQLLPRYRNDKLSRHPTIYETELFEKLTPGVAALYATKYKTRSLSPGTFFDKTV